MSKKRTHKQYTKEFKEEAVSLILQQGYSVAQAAESLGIGQACYTSGRTRWKINVRAKL